MVKAIINGTEVCVENGTTILNAALSAGIKIPTLCYLENINEIGACRVCIVEIEGMQKLIASCNTILEDGMVIYTNSPKVRKARKNIVSLILSQHDCECATCVRSGNCALQAVANDLGILQIPYKKELKEPEWPKSFPIIRNASKCVKCMRCIQVCDKIQGMHIWDIEGTGGWTDVDVSGHRKIKESECTVCGQCVTHCPVGALRERDDTAKVFKALSDPDTVTVVQVAPAVRTAWAEYWGLDEKTATPGRLVSAIKQLGFDYVFDTDFSADLTVMEEASEFIERLKHKENYTFPLFTSCCPGWVKFIKTQYPDMIGQLSTAKSPQQMFGAVAKSYFAQKVGIDPHKIFCVSVMPCTAKKAEIDLPGMNSACGDPDVDVALTTRELVRMLRADNVKVEELPEEDFFSPLGTASGAGVIFGASGGVAEAALRSAYYLITGKNPDPDAFKSVRGIQGWKEATFEIGDLKVRTAVASGLGNVRKLIEALRNGEVSYDFVEMMACPGGCAGGGGQPIKLNHEEAKQRGDILYMLDAGSRLRFSHENPNLKQMYKEFFKHPLSEKSHELLHIEQE